MNVPVFIAVLLWILGMVMCHEYLKNTRDGFWDDVSLLVTIVILSWWPFYSIIALVWPNFPFDKKPEEK